jgi:hypothetical protein
MDPRAKRISEAILGHFAPTILMVNPLLFSKEEFHAEKEQT